MALPALWTISLLAGIAPTSPGSSSRLLCPSTSSTGRPFFLAAFGCYGSSGLLPWSLCFSRSHSTSFFCRLLATVIVEITFRRYEHFTAQEVARWTGWSVILVGSFLVVFGMIWTSPHRPVSRGFTGLAWKYRSVIPAIIFWGFPLGRYYRCAHLSLGPPADIPGCLRSCRTGWCRPHWDALPHRTAPHDDSGAYQPDLYDYRDPHDIRILPPASRCRRRPPETAEWFPASTCIKKAFEGRHFGYACALG